MRLLNYRPMSRPSATAPRGGGNPVESQLAAIRQEAETLLQQPVDPAGGSVSPFAKFQSSLLSAGSHLLGTVMGVVRGGWDGLRGLLPTKTEEPTGGGLATVRMGAKGASVRTLQEKLRARGFDPGPLDGDFGPRTDGAVRAFQRAKGLTVDGIVGPQTWGALGGATGPAPAPAPTPGGNAKAQQFIEQAKRFLGRRYVWGGGHASSTRVGTVDCSGLVLQAARLAGFNLDGTAAMQQQRGRPVSMGALQPGDLLFHGTPASHVGIYIGNGQAIHASSTQGKVVIVNLSSYTYFNNARRVL
jgi:cell wall-associated NlpC family hydrolase